MLLIFMLAGMLATSSCSHDSFTPSDSSQTKTEGDVKIFVTSNNRAYDFYKHYQDFSNNDNMSPNTITLDPNTKFQTMDGFGAAITGSTCYNLLKMTQEDRTKFLTETFSDTEGMGMNYIRIAIGCSDFSLSEYTCWDDQNGSFALQNEEVNYIIPILKEILAINPSIKIIGSPWTSPKWMKVNNLTDLKPHDSWTDGQLNPAHYQNYGTYFVNWLQAFDQQGIKVSAITVQNEPLNRGNSASLYMTWQEQLAFVKSALGPKLRAAGLSTKIYAFDHNYNYDNIADQNDYPINIYNDPIAASYFAGSAYHNYGGNKEELLDIHQQRPDKEIIFTETSIGTWNDGQDLATRLTEDMQEVALGTVNNWSKAVIVWNLMLDSERGPNRAGGCQTCYGAVDINSKNYKNIVRNSHYYIVGHLSGVVKSGATRIGTSGYQVNGLVYSAFQNLDGSYALVASNNTNDAQKITVSDGTNHFSYEIPVKSVASYQWK
ncbi:glycoside hydrolase family 30 protein [Sphingobacterium hungaricum]|nr:glycoside hydrolase family 30 beta sandwich domain-containing protein [Sphingobacterium hungaricum]